MSACQQTIDFKISDESLLHLPEGDVYSRLCELDWDLTDAVTTDFTHGMHSYPAKFIPQIPARLIALLSRPGELVVDPFSGGGTTGVEALRLDRQFVGLDANPIAVLLGRVKTSVLTRRDREELHALIHQIHHDSESIQGPVEKYVPAIPNMSKWYSPRVTASLSRMRQHIEEIASSPAKNIALVAFANTAARVSFQDSETRYVSKPREIDLGKPVQTFVSEIKRIIAIAAALDGKSSTQLVDFRFGDAREPRIMEIEPQAAGLVVTSPPYPNAYDYHLYHRFRLFWLGADPSTLRNVEIGSHLKYQNQDDPTTSYESDMKSVLQNLYEILMPGRYCAVVLGDGVFGGKRYHTSRNLARVAECLGWSVLPVISRNLPLTRRSVTAAGRRLATEEILLLQRPRHTSRHMEVGLSGPNYRRFPYEDLLARREITELFGSEMTENGPASLICVDSDGVLSEARKLAFWHAIKVERNGAAEIPTVQRLLEDPSGGRRKHSTYVTHGLHRYKGKFYPQLAKALINLSRLPAQGAVVVDPFGGSGTVLLESVINGRNAIAIDCNPLAVAVAQSKVDILEVDIGVLCRSSESLIEGIASLHTFEGNCWDQFEPSTRDELGSWFAPKVLVKLGSLLERVREAPDPRLVAFYEVVVSDIVRDVSQQEPRDLRIRRRRIPVTDAPVMELFSDRLRAVVSKIVAYHGISDEMKPRRGVGQAVLGSSADSGSYVTLDSRDGLIDCVISSPPYATALPYLDTDRLSLAAVYGIDRKHRGYIERNLIGSRETSKTEMRDFEERIKSGLDDELPISTASFLQELLETTLRDESAGFRKRQLPTVLSRYFLGIAHVMDQMKPRIREGAHLWFVLGNSRTNVGGRQWIIPTTDEVAAIARSAGFESVEEIPITVTREDVAHSKHSITENTIVHLRAPNE